MRASVKLVGQRAGGREHVVAHAREGDPVLLLPEPDNPHDANAIAVYTAPRATLTDSTFLPERETWEIGDEDRMLLIDRQAGYVPASVNERFAIPPEGIVGVVSTLRWHPPEYDANGRELEARVAGFDVSADWPMRGGRK